MIVTLVYVHVKKEHVSDFIRETERNHRASLREQGNLRFDVLQDEVEETKFVLYEAYETQDAVDAHKETDHYKAWRAAVGDWMDEPRKGIRHKVVAPKDPASW